MTRRLYYDNSYLVEFEAHIVEQYRKGDRFAVILDQTAFYPMAGGQMADRGFLNGLAVEDVVEEGKEVAHLISEPLSSTTVVGKIDWQRRFDFMQQHTGFHILAQSFLQVLRMGTISSHLGESKDTIDVNATRLSWDEVERVEQLANKIVFENRPVHSYFVSRREIEQLSLRKPPKFLNRPIRLVEIEGFDLDPCGGTHVNHTGEVGLIKIFSWEKVRDHLRCTFVAGNRALQDYQTRIRVVQQINQLLSTGGSEAPEQIRLLKQNLKAKDGQIKKLNEMYLSLKAEALMKGRKRREDLLWIQEFHEMEASAIRHLAVLVSKEVSAVLAFFRSEEPAYLILTCNSALGVDFRPLIPGLRELLRAKGGGNANFVEFNHADPTQFGAAFTFLKSQFTRRLQTK